jgi:membrane-bound lytic murein transglycosylase D
VSPIFKLRVPRGTKVPPGRLFSVDGAGDDYNTYQVRQGDTPSSIARATGTSEILVRNVNRIGASEVLAQGSLVLVPRAPASAIQPAPSKDDDVVVVARALETPPDCVRVFYPVVIGDTVAEVALAFGVQRAELLAWNALDPAARLQEGMVLQVFPKASFNLARVRALKEGAVRVLVAGSSEFFDFFEGNNGKRRLVVTVKSGDTLASIGRRYDTSVGWMERINRRPRTDRLSVGETVVVYADRAKFPAAAKSAARPSELAPPAGSLAALEGTGTGAATTSEARKMPSRVQP